MDNIKVRVLVETWNLKSFKRVDRWKMAKVRVTPQTWNFKSFMRPIDGQHNKFDVFQIKHTSELTLYTKYGHPTFEHLVLPLLLAQVLPVLYVPSTDATFLCL